MPRLKILLVSARYFPSMGGTETHTYEVGKRLAAARHDVTVLTTNPGNRLTAHERADGMQILRVRAWPANVDSFDYFFAPGIYSTIRRGQWDVIHVQGYHTFVAPFAMLAAWHSKIPYVVTFHSGGHSSQARNSMRRLQHQMLRPLLARASQLIGVSEFEADFFAERLALPRSRFAVIQNGAKLPQVDENPVRASECPDAGDLIVSVGRLERYKRHQAVISAFARLREERPAARLRIAGSGPYEPELRDLIRDLNLGDSVEIGAIPASDRRGMANLLTRASLVTLLSEYEAHPVAVMEALSLRRPVLVSDTSGLRELAQRGLVSAVGLDSSDAEVAAAMLRQLNEPLIPSELDLPTWEACTEQLLGVYQRVANLPELVGSSPASDSLAG